MKTLLSIAAFCAFCIVATGAVAQSDLVRQYTDAQGQQVTLYSGQPKPENYGPRPSFEELDRNQDGVITLDEAEAYIPLLNDFDNVSFPHGVRISRAEYARWDKQR